jgi:chromate reductase
LPCGGATFLVIFTMTIILGISGSLRRASYNSALLRAASDAAPDEVRVDIASIRGVPLYDGDVENESGIPAIVQELKEQIARADGLLLVTPEYNNSIPGVFKNAIDWLSRPPNDIPRIFGGRAVALMGATPGRAGTLLAHYAWLPVLRTLGTRPWFGPRLMVSEANRVFGPAGELLDQELHSQLRSFLSGFAEFIARR